MSWTQNLSSLLASQTCRHLFVKSRVRSCPASSLFGQICFPWAEDGLSWTLQEKEQKCCQNIFHFNIPNKVTLDQWSVLLSSRTLININQQSWDDNGMTEMLNLKVNQLVNGCAEVTLDFATLPLFALCIQYAYLPFVYIWDTSVAILK